MPTETRAAAATAASEQNWTMGDDSCDRCGGGIDGDHPTTCGACRYELATGRNYERDVDSGEYQRRRALAAGAGRGEVRDA